MTVNPVLAHCSLTDEIERFAPRDDESGRRAQILVKEDDLRVTLVTMRSGAETAEHSAPSSISIQVLQGRFEVTFGADSARLGPGDLISLRHEASHSVRAIEDGAFLLTLGWSAG